MSTDADAVNELLRLAVVEWTRTDAGRDARLRPETRDARRAGRRGRQHRTTGGTARRQPPRAGAQPSRLRAALGAWPPTPARTNRERVQLAEVAAAEPRVSTVAKWGADDTRACVTCARRW